MGIFSGSGIGKSTVLSMMARHTDAEISVIGLVGERGREARELIEDDLGPEGMARSVIILATSDEPPLMRRQAAYLSMTVAEYFRDRGDDVLYLMDQHHPIRLPPSGRSACRPESRRPPRASPHRSSPSCRDCWSAPVPAALTKVRLPACSRSSLKATTTTSPSRTPCAASWTATWSSTGPSPNGAAIRQSTCYAACREQCPTATHQMRTISSSGRGSSSRLTRTWRS